MPLVINTNVAALNAQRQLVSSGNDMNQAMERLSSGRRINTAGDDAAGLAISNRQTSQIRGLSQAIRNASDGVSLIQTAEGALDETTNILQRMRELSIQAANGIYSDTDRATLDAEFQQLLDELDRIAETTSFNGQKLLDGSLGDVSLQVGADAYQIIDFSIDDMRSDKLGLGSLSTDLSGDRLDGALAGNINIIEGDILINGQAMAAFTNTQDNENLQTLIDDINENIEGVTASGFNVAEATSTGSGTLSSGDTLTITLHAIDGGSDVTYTLDTLNTLSMDEVAEAINNKTGGAVDASISDSGRLVLSNASGATMTVTADVNTQAATGFAASTVYHGSLALASEDGSPITITTGANGTDAQLESLGFRRVEGAGIVVSEPLSSVEQSTALASGDIFINGVPVPADEADNLAAKVDNINSIQDTTGVVASIVAMDSYTTNFDDRQELVMAAAAVAANTLANGDDISVNGVTVSIVGATPPSGQEIAAAINAANAGVEAYVDDNGDLHLASPGQITIGDGPGTGGFANLVAGGNLVDMGGANAAVDTPAGVATLAGEAGSIKINNVEVSLTDLSNLDTLFDDINARSGDTGVRAQIDSNGELQLSSTSSISLEVGNTLGLTSAAAMGINFTDAADDGTLANDTIIIQPRIKLDSTNDQPISLEVTANGSEATGLSNLNTDLSALVTGSSIANLSIQTALGAQDSIASIDQALETINSTRSELGAIYNRLEFTMANLSNITENTAAARSRIVDADFAAESANLSRAQVLQQASQAMLAQANAQPQQVLQLLQG